MSHRTNRPYTGARCSSSNLKDAEKPGFSAAMFPQKNAPDYNTKVVFSFLRTGVFSSVT